jgi:hypothetical protein
MESFDPADQLRVLDQWPQSIRWTLPRRRMGGERLLGIPLILAGLLILAALVLLVSGFVFGFWPKRIDFCFVAPLVLLAIPTRAGFVPMWWGLALLFGYRELEMRDGYLRTTERVGPLWYGKRWPVVDIQRLDIKGTRLDKSSPKYSEMDSRYALLLYTPANKTGTLAWGYPEKMLRQVAEEIAQRAEKMIDLKGLREVGEDEAAGPIAVTTSAIGDESAAQSADSEAGVPPPSPRPADTTIEVDPFDDGVTIRVPPLGLSKGSGGLFSFSLLWNGFNALFTFVMVMSFLQDRANPKDNLWVAFLVIGLFWVIGVILLLISFHLGRRHAAIAIAGGTLMVIQKGLFGTKQREWPLEHVSAIDAGPSGMEVNDRPLLELQIYDQDGDKFGVLCGRSDAELHWLAGLLRETTGVPHEIADAKPTPLERLKKRRGM